MPTYLLGTPERTTRKINRKNVFYQCDFDLPESVKDALPAEQVDELNGFFICGFYADPQVGSEVVHNGHIWEVTKIRFVVERYNSKKPRHVATLLMKYLGSVEG